LSALRGRIDGYVSKVRTLSPKPSAIVKTDEIWLAGQSNRVYTHHHFTTHVLPARR
jgi:hypothetical protein